MTTCTIEQCHAFLASGGFRYAGAQPDISAMQTAFNDLSAKIGFWELFAKATQLFAIWSGPDWSTAGIIAKVKATYDLFKQPIPNPGPMGT